MPPKFYTECKCLDDRLANLLRKAVDALVETDPTYRDVESGAATEREQMRRELQSKLVDLRSFGASNEQLKALEANLMSKLPVSKEAEEIEALRKYVDECECDESVHIDWMKFPYHETTFYTGKTGRKHVPAAGSCSTDISSDQLSEWTDKVRKYNEKFVAHMTEEKFNEMNKKYGELDWAQSELKRELVKDGILEEWQLTEWFDLNNKIRNACKGADGTATNLMHTAETAVQRLRSKFAEEHAIKLRGKEEYGFGKKK